MNEQLKKWIADYDNGSTMESVSMGGLGDGYEAAIQDCEIETMRNLQEISVPEETQEFSDVIRDASDAAADLLDNRHGFTGAQVGAAKNIAAVFWRQTPERGLEMMREQDPSRIIKIRKGENGVVCVIQ